MKKPRQANTPRWGVYFLKRMADRFPFTVNAATPEEAMEWATKE
jgi:hypothetical protein